MLHNAGPGISTIGDVNGLIQGNTSSHNGFYLDGSGRSATSGNGIGIQGLAMSTTDTNDKVLGNVTDNNAGNGIDIESLANLIEGNTAVGNGQVFGTFRFTFDLFDRSVNCGTNTWIDNTFTTNSPPCTGRGGRQVASSALPATRVGPNAPTSSSPTLDGKENGRLRGRSIL